MNIKQMKSILCEYRPSMRLMVKIDRTAVWETTVAEVLCKLMEIKPEKSTAIFSRDSCIIRERVRLSERETGPPCKEWLEIDLR